MEPTRSLLFVPANKEDWLRSSPEKYPADGFIFDLEDAVPPGQKGVARDVLAECNDVFESTDGVVTVRVNDPRTDHIDDDLDALVGLAVDAVVVPGVANAAEVERIGNVLSHLERIRGVDDEIEIVALPETARGLNNVGELCRASHRVTAVVGASGKDSDSQRDVGYEFTREGRERQYLLSQVVMDARAAGVDELIAGVWMDVDDIEGLRDELEFVRRLGYTGMMVIHPSHVEPVNEAFTPADHRVERAERLVETYEEAEGEGAIRFEGDMIDVAHVKTARKLLERARTFE